MTAISQLTLSDRLLAATLALLTAATLIVAAESHLLCSIFCIHGDRMIETEICSGKG